MATIKQYNLAGLNANVELGKNGSYIVGGANTIGLYNANDQLQKVSIANAVTSNQAVTLAQLNSLAEDLVQHITVDVTHTSGTANIVTIPAGSKVLTVTVEVDAAWTGANAATSFIEVGDTGNGSRFIRSQDVDVTKVAQYHSQYQYEYLNEGVLTYSVTQGSATAGNAIISVVLIADYELNTDTEPTYAIEPAANTVNEGANITFTVTTTNLGSDTLYWTTSGDTAEGDFVASSGNVTIANDTGEIVVQVQDDLTTEGSETFFVQLRTGSVSGDIVATSSNVTISDTSITPATELANVLALEPILLYWRDESAGTVLSNGSGATATNGDLVGRILDLSGNDNHAIAAGDDNRATLTATGWSFDGLDDHYSLTNDITVTNSMTIVRGFTRPGTGQDNVSHGLGNRTSFSPREAIIYNNLIYVALVGQQSATTSTVVTGNCVLTSIRNGGTQSVRFNQTQLTLDNTVLGTMGGTMGLLGRQGGGLSVYNDGEISFLAVFPTVLTGANLTLVENIAQRITASPPPPPPPGPGDDGDPNGN